MWLRLALAVYDNAECNRKVPRDEHEVQEPRSANVLSVQNPVKTAEVDVITANVSEQGHEAAALKGAAVTWPGGLCLRTW